jgi:glycosyltransferase involved in cell wall biosynthesis
MPLVSVITRTKERPLMMVRAVESVRRQTYSDFEWVIVNDGGARDPVESVAESARRSNLAVRVLHNDHSLGMEGASNRGIRESDSEFIVIHDDDDTWDVSFLARTTEYLRALPPRSAAGGVVTQSMQILERIEPNGIQEIRRVPYDPRLTSITLFRMAHLNHVPPPISFLYKREVLSRVGLYRDDLEVLGDWEFNLRFLRHFDIDVIPERLANYHWRMNQSGIYGNTVVAGIDRHALVAGRLRNELLRRDLDNGTLDIGFLVNLCQEFDALTTTSLPIVILRRLLPRKLVLRLAELFR